MDDKKYTTPTEQDLRLYKYVSERIRKGFIGTSEPFNLVATSLCDRAVYDGLICEYKIMPTEGNLTLNSKQQVLGRVGLRLRPDLEAKTYLVGAQMEG